MFEQRDFTFIYKYFLAEKQAAVWILIVGVIAVILSLIFWFFIKNNPSFFKGAAIPLMVLGLLQMVVGYSVYSRTDKQKADIAYKIGMEPVSFVKSTELPRMQKVMKRFEILKWAEIVLFITALVLIFLFRSNPAKAFWFGFGVTLAIQITILFSLDFFAEKRGAIYTNELQKIVSGQVVQP